MSILCFDVTLEGKRERERKREGGRESERDRRGAGGGGCVKTSALMFVGQMTNSSCRRKIRTLPSCFFHSAS